jgi:hypothetical protein
MVFCAGSGFQRYRTTDVGLGIYVVGTYVPPLRNSEAVSQQRPFKLN